VTVFGYLDRDSGPTAASWFFCIPQIIHLVDEIDQVNDDSLL
jgi:hypothetical protein